jgi:integrase
MKAGKPHTVPLSSLAIAVLGRQATVRTGDAVFPGRNNNPISYPGVFAAAKKENLGFDVGTPHSWRSIFRDACGDKLVCEGKLGVDRDLAEAALAHALPDVEGSYRRGTAIERRRPVMESYAAFLTGKGADNVVALEARRA